MSHMPGLKLWALGFTTLLAACGAGQTANPQASFTAGQQKLATKEEAGGTTTKQSFADKLAAEEKARRDGDVYLEGRIDQQAVMLNEKIAALQAEDQKLWAAIDALSERLTAEVARLDGKDTELQAQLASVIAQHKEQLDKLKASMDAGFAASKEELEATRKTLRDELALVGAELKTSLEAKLAENTTALLKTDSAFKAYIESHSAGLWEQLNDSASMLSDKIALMEAGVWTQDIEVAKLKELLGKIEAVIAKGPEAFIVELREKPELVKDVMKLAGEGMRAEIEATAKIVSGELTNALTGVKNDLLLRNDQLGVAFNNRLTSDMASVRTLLEAQKSELMDRITESSGETRAAFIAEVKRLDATLAKSDLEVKAALTERAKSESDLRHDLEVMQAGLLAQIDATAGQVRADLTQAFTDADNDLRLKLQATIHEKVKQVADDLNAFKIYADQTYATKAELKALNVIVVGLQDATNLLGAKIDATDKRISSEMQTLRNDFGAQLAEVSRDVNLVKTKLDGHIKTYESTVAALYAKSTEQAGQIGLALAGLSTNQAGLTALNDKLEALNGRVTDAEFAAQEMGKDLASTLKGLEDRQDQLAADVVAAKDAAAQSYANAVASNLAAQDELRKQINFLFSEVKRVEGLANDAEQLARANQESIKGLRDDLEAAKTQWSAQLAEMKGEFNTKIMEVKTYAEKIVEHLDGQTQTQMVEFATTLADLQARTSSIEETLARHLNTAADAAAVAAFLREKIEFDSLVERITNTADAAGTTAGFFMDAIDVYDHKAGVPNLEINKDFKLIAALPECGGITGDRPGEEGQQPAVGGKPWYIHLARAYVRHVIAGVRTGDQEIDKILFGSKALAPDSLEQVAVLAIIPPFSLGTKPGCSTKVEEWARALLTDKVGHGVALRKVLAANVNVKAAVTSMLAPSLAAIVDAARDYEIKLHDLLKPNLATDQAVKDFLAKGTEKLPGFRAVLADVIVEDSENRYRIATLEQNVESVVQLARKSAEGLSDAQARLTRLEGNYQELLKKIDAVAKITPERIARLESGVIASFNLIAAIASRLGYTDIVELAKIEAGKLDGGIDRDLLIPYGIEACSFYYNYALQEGEALRRCDSGVNVGNGNYGDAGNCRAAIAMREVTTTNVVQNVVNKTGPVNVVLQRNGYPWQVFTDAASCRTQMAFWYDWALSAGQIAVYNPGLTRTAALARCDQASAAGAVTQTITNALTTTTVQQYPLGPAAAVLGTLRMPIQAPDHPESILLAKVPAGSPYPAHGKTMIVGRFWGNAYKLRISDDLGNSYVVNAADFKTAAKALNVYEEPLSIGFTKADAPGGFAGTLLVEALDAANKVVGKKCSVDFNAKKYIAERTTQQNVTQNVTWVQNATSTLVALVTYSPIVLDLAAKGDVDTVAAAESNVSFDLAASGQPRRVGWIKPGAGFLVRDLNQNGKIDDGAEMFGDHTKLQNGAKAPNGYAALADLVGGKDFVDVSDAVFAELKVWVDANENGVTDAGELKALAEHGITKIGAKAEDVALAERAVARGNGMPNYKLYQNRFWGPEKCGQEGCKSFDVYFGSSQLPTKLSAK